MILHGHAKLELLRKGKVIKRIENNNTITPFVANAITKGDFNGVMDRKKILPIVQNWFGGCILTDAPNPNNDDISGFFGMIGQNTNIIAMAGNDSYSGINHRRGSADFTSGATGPIENGYRFVFRWSENQGNGHIESVCLTRPNLGKVHFLESGNFDYEDDQTLPKTYANDQLSDGTFLISDAVMKLTIIDYENEIGYKVWYEGDNSSGEIKIEEYALNTWRQHITGSSCDIRNMIGSTHVISVSGGVKNYSLSNSAVVYTGTGNNREIHLITYTYSSNKAVLNDYVINPLDYSSLKTTYSRQYSGVEFKDYSATFASYTTITKDGFWIEYENNTPYLYGVAEVSNVDKIVKCNLTNDADVSEVIASPYSVDYQAPWIGLPNGDRFKASRNSTEALYWHNNKWYKTNLQDYHVQGNLLQGIHGGSVYGTNILKYDANRPQDVFKIASLDAFFPWVSTVNNLQTSVDKNITMTMNLVYEITESTN